MAPGNPIYNLFAAGGVVMFPLLAFSILAIALIIERVIFWSRLGSYQNTVVEDALKFYRENNVVSTLDRLRKNTDLPIARIFLVALELDSATPEDFRLALESAAQAEIPLLKRFQNIFETIISLAPLLGLLGTVLGLINAFKNINIGSATGTPIGGISEALVSTASGLVVAIITLLFANTFRGLYLRQIAQIQEYGGQLELLYRRYYQRGDKNYAPTR
ncbi:MAG: MotA/TolQ/ExbB proton channel family protein [Calothrix sp. MO_192.B10]|nr:MotA/TolQ/ExbB proton channel family protein [Calothrix sp. MO_192.B10]